ncbi:MAG TPA: serine/threonine-protein kinase [Pantanalinema sp.]
MQPFDPRILPPHRPRADGPFVPAFAAQAQAPGFAAASLDFHPYLPLPAGTLLARRFEITEALGEGHCGYVYLVRDRAAQNALRALKTFDPRRGEAKDAELFRREARLLKRLDHPRIPKGYDLCDHRGMLCACVAFVQGEDLLAHVQQHGPMPEREAQIVMRQVLESLIYLHGQKPAVLHRDLKPENLIRDQAGTIHLIDFGSASDRPQDKQGVALEALTTLHTMGYAAPEQALGLEAYPASDLYSLAATVLYLLTGKNPLVLYNGMEGRLAWKVPLSGGFDALLSEMLALPAKARVQSAREALARLDGFTI